MDIILKLREYRKDRGYTQLDMANMLGCSVSTYSKYETGERKPVISALVKLADFYFTSIDELVGHVPCSWIKEEL